jgi:hypothetical protein
MKTFLSLIISVIIILEAPQIISLKEYYCGKGVIFDKDYKYPFVEDDYDKAITPNRKQIIEAENLMDTHYYEYRKSVLDSFKSNYQLDKKFKNFDNVKKKFFKYYRQYAGYTNKSNDTIIYIGLFNFSNKKKAKKYFEGWDKTLFLGSDGFYKENQEFYLINLTKGKIVFK